jgi:hypothetical protein
MLRRKLVSAVRVRRRLSPTTKGSMNCERPSTERGRFLGVGAAGTLGLLLTPETVLANEEEAELLRWDLVAITQGGAVGGSGHGTPFNLRRHSYVDRVWAGATQTGRGNRRRNFRAQARGRNCIRATDHSLDASQNRHAKAAAALRQVSGPFLLSPFVLAELDYLPATRAAFVPDVRC